MKKLHYSIDINAPKEKVWNTMLGKETYGKWTEVFASGSHYEGSWEEGSKIRFLAPDELGNKGGMLSHIKENRKHEFISIEHLGIIEDGKEITDSEEVKEWAGALENYTLRERNGKTEVLIDMDTEEDYEEMMQEMWPQALQKLKELAEK
ncbi:SRPBCC domain-containing protein [Fodinibius sp. Rm-B-1B1-1]|uniref:SRPBCC family protein n=1 Tax=Fodinibius alkaliphilus TaxID=3140241 RepID=UPI00315ADD09